MPNTGFQQELAQLLMSRGAPYANMPQPLQQPSLGYIRDPALYQSQGMSPQPQQQSQSQGGGLPTGLLSKFMGGGAPAGANTAGTVATDSGSFGPSMFDAGGLSSDGGFAGAVGSDVAPGGAAAGSGAGGSAAGGGGGAGLGAFALPAAYAAAIGIGANTEANHANTPLGDGLLAGLAPSIAQLLKDPKGMGIPTALGFPFLTPFTASSEAKATKPEFSGLFGLGF